MPEEFIELKYCFSQDFFIYFHNLDEYCMLDDAFYELELTLSIFQKKKVTFITYVTLSLIIYEICQY